MTTDSGLIELGRALLRHRRLLLGGPVACAFVIGVVSLFIRPTYTATTTFVPETNSQTRLPANLGGLAAQFGFSFGSEASKSPKFYAEVLRSRELMEHVLLDKYVDRSQ